MKVKEAQQLAADNQQLCNEYANERNTSQVLYYITFLVVQYLMSTKDSERGDYSLYRRDCGVVILTFGPTLVQISISNQN